MTRYATIRNIEAVKHNGYLSLSILSKSANVRYTLERDQDNDGVEFTTATLNAEDLLALYEMDEVSIGRTEKDEFELYLCQVAERN
jgi:hypothetical protein